MKRSIDTANVSFGLSEAKVDTQERTLRIANEYKEAYLKNPKVRFTPDAVTAGVHTIDPRLEDFRYGWLEGISLKDMRLPELELITALYDSSNLGFQMVNFREKILRHLCQYSGEYPNHLKP